MRHLYNEFFYIPKYGKGRIREKVMFARVAVTVVIMVACLAVMGISAYAFFSHSISSGSNIIKSANFETAAAISITGKTGGEVEVTTAGHSHTAILQEGVEYTVTLAKGGTANTGFCVVTAEGCGKTYHTQQIGVNGENRADEISFYVTVSETAQIKILSHWGTSSYYADYMDKGESDELYILDGEEIAMAVSGGTEIMGVEGETGPAPTPEPETTVTETTVTETAVPDESADDVYTIRSGDNLTVIAQKYNTTVERLAAYNEIENADAIQAGQEIRIPPEDWVIPETTATETAETTTTAESSESEPAASSESETAA